MVVSIIFFIIIFCVIVVSHEFGHYIIGKRNGIHAQEFFIGVGPKLFSKEIDGTLFSVRLLPFGGACIFEGMDELENGSEPSEHSFLNASVWARFATTLAGPFFNVILAYIMGVILASVCGVVVPEIQTVIEDSAAEEAGLMPGDVIVKINSKHIHLSDEVSFSSFYSDGSPMDITVKRGDEKIKFTITPKYSEEDKRYYIGITNGKYVECKGALSLKYGFYNVEYILRATVESLRLLVRGRLSKDDLAGPVGIVKAVDDSYDYYKPYGMLAVVMSMVNITMLLSANLAVMNILPLPALDGGRLVFLIIEAIRRKPIPPEKEGYVNLAGMAFLLVVVIFVFINDITKFFR
ncbi:MAG: M50 family metallopeptidase [Lachnospiraceae bacterium]|nr:M50 family metallopeptidase [Lachnospiraceae bacterium]